VRELSELEKTLFKDRIRLLNTNETKSGRYVLYWMQASQRTEYNHVLEYALFESKKLRKPLLVFFGITENFPEGNERHYRFMLEGLREVKSSLGGRGIEMTMRQESKLWPRSASLIAVAMLYGRKGLERRQAAADEETGDR
jgi:deoxyribodipyrimidine photolyase